jgi:ERCC4-type nuclease
MKYNPKAIEFPENFVLIVDTREQRSLFTRIPKGLVISSATLHDGDYSVRGFENKICFERKGISDLYPYCSTERDKTIAKMNRFAKFDFVGLVIEAKESEVFKIQQFTKVHPECIKGALISFAVRSHVHVYFGDREQCARWVLERAVKFWNIQHEIN